MLEIRVKRLEEDMAEVKSDMKAVLGKLSHIEGRLGEMPSYPNLVGLFGATVAAVGMMIAVATYVLRLPT